jgi:hypothetical protein
VLAADAEELIGKVGTRTLSPLRRMPDDAFRRGLRDLVSDARSGRLRFPVTGRLDLAVFVSTESGSHSVRYP